MLAGTTSFADVLALKKKRVHAGSLAVLRAFWRACSIAMERLASPYVDRLWLSHACSSAMERHCVSVFRLWSYLFNFFVNVYVHSS